MKVVVRNKFFTMSGSSEVKDEEGKLLYKVKGRLISPTRMKFICDKSGKVIYRVRNKFINFFVHHAFIYDANKNKIAHVKDKAVNIHKEFFVLGYKDEIRTEGAFFSMSCTIFRNDEPIGTIRRKVDFTDCFEIEAEEADMPFLIALVVAVDNITDKKRSS